MSHVNNFIFLKVSLSFCFSTPQRTILGSKTAFNEGMEHLQLVIKFVLKSSSFIDSVQMQP